MLAVRVIPCLDTRDGRVVKGVKFGSLRDAGTPEDLAHRYQEEGADELVILDVSATPEGRANQTETVARVRQRISIPLTVGGGVRKASDVSRLLMAGADKVGVNTAAVTDPSIINLMAREFGSQCTVVAIDAASRDDSKGWEVVVHSGEHRTGIDALEWAKKVQDLGAGEILLTSWDRDGTRIGYDLDLLAAVSKSVSIPVIASGGANSPLHFCEAVRAGADAVLAASVFHYGDYTVGQVKQYLLSQGIRVRL